MLNTPQEVPAVYVYSGLEGFDFLNDTADPIQPGTVVKMATSAGNVYGIARQLIPAGAQANLAGVGVFDLKMDGGSTFVFGDLVYFDITNQVAASDGSYSGDIIGICVAPTAANTDVSVRTWLTSFYVPPGT